MEYKKNGITNRLNDLYRSALQSNKYVPDYLLGNRKLPKQSPEYIGHGDTNEAVDYVLTLSSLWVKLPELILWLSEQRR